MEITLLIGLASVVLLLILGLGYFFSGRTQIKEENVNRGRPAPNRLRDGVPRRAQLARNRGIRLRANAAQQHDNELEEEDVIEQEPNADLGDGKIGAKKRAKLEAKAEKKAQREADEHTRSDKKKREQIAEEERKKAEEKEKLEAKVREDEERQAREEKEKRDHEEYLKMKEAFSVEEEGYEEGDEDESRNLLQEFVNYIKNNKVVVIEDLAAHFKLKTQAAIDRIKDLLNDDILTGVIDDRGKFIYVSMEEMEAVAKFIRQRGRVSIAELAENSNKLINLVPTVVS